MTDLRSLHDAVAGFGQLIGLPGWALDAQGRAALRLQSGAAMAIELQGDGQVLLLLECPIARAGPELLQAALAAAHRCQGLLLQLGLRGSGADQVLILATRLQGRQASPPLLARCFDQMAGWFARLEPQWQPQAAGAPR